MRPLSSAVLAVLLASTVSIAHAQTKAAPAAASSQTATKPDTVLATVNGEKITQLDLEIAYSQLSDSAKQQLQTTGFGALLNELINAKAIEIQARAEKLDQDPTTKSEMTAAANTVLQNALLRKDISPLLTEDKIKAAYQAQYAGKAGEEEVHAEHILVKTQAEAQGIIDQLNRGGNFEALAKANSSDQSASTGGDLGWFKKGDMVAAFANAAFALKPGTFSQTPVQSPYGFHVIKVLGTRQSAPQTLDQVHDALAQQMEQAALQAELAKLRGAAKVLVADSKGKLVTEAQAEAEAKAKAAPAGAAPAAKSGN